MARVLGTLLGFIMLAIVVGCGGGSTPPPAPTPTSQIFPNNQQLAQAAPVSLGTSGANSTDVGAKVCCLGTLGSLWTKSGVTNPVILSNNHVLDKSGSGVPGEAINQPLQLACTNPSSPGPITVANLTQGIALKPTTSTPGKCGVGDKAVLCGPSPLNVDAAIAEIIPGQVDLTGGILDLGAAGATTIAAAPPSSTIGVPTLGEGVGKSGRTSGLTCSTIDALNANLSIDYEASCGDTSPPNNNPPAFSAIYVNQVMIAGAAFSAGGDSGSLIVDTATARPVALLYGGSDTDTVANPIQDVINVFGGPASFTIVGGADHQISCAHTASASGTQVGAAQAALVPQEQQRVAAVQQRRAAQLIRDHSVQSVTVGASADNPREGALLIHVSGSTIPQIQPTIDGVRTRLVFDASGAATHGFSIGSSEISRATVAKEAHVSSLMGQPGIQGVGVTISLDNPTEAAMAIYVIKGVTHPPIPAVIDGVRTRVFEGSRFKAY
jgi:hypothetical protein